MRKIKVIVCKTTTGYSCHTNEFLGVVSTGVSLDELKINFTEVIVFHFEGLKEDGEFVPENYDLIFCLDE